MTPGAFADSETKVVQVLQQAARRDEAANPRGARWVIEVPDLPQERPDSHAMVMANASINQSYCFESVLSRRSEHGILLRNYVFSDSAKYESVQFSRAAKPAEYREWKRGYFEDPTWRKPPLEPGSENSIARTFSAQKAFASRLLQLRAVQERTFQSCCERDEERLSKCLVHKKRKRHAMAEANADQESDVSL